MTMYINGRQFSDAGQMQATDGSGGVPEGSFFYEGWAMTQEGRVYVWDLGASAVPADANFISGVAFNDDGAMYVTTQVPSSPRFISGIAIRNDGAMHVSTSAVSSGDSFINGWAIAQTGAARMDIA